MKKRSIIIGLISSIFALSIAGLVSAAVSAAEIAGGIQSFLDGISTALAPIFSFLLGDVTGTGAHGPTFFLLAKLLIFVLVGSIALAVTDFIPLLSESKNKWMKWVIVLIFDVLAVRFLEASTISAIILPYSVAAVALTAILPFVVYTIAIYKGTESRTFRRLAWIFFAAIFIVLWTVRYDELAGAKWIYPLTALAALVMLFIDGTLISLFRGMESEKVLSTGRQRDIATIRIEMSKLGKELAAGNIPPKEYDEFMKDLNARLKKLESQQ